MTTSDQLNAKRKQFWETRNNGSSQVWSAIKMAVDEPNQATGQAILNSLRITMLNNSIQMCVDSKFNKYQVPIFCLNEPLSFAQQTIGEKNLNFDYNDADIKVKIRSVKYPTEDIVLNLKFSHQIAHVKKSLRQHKNIPVLENIRFFYIGRQMKDNRTLGNYSYTEGNVIQAMIK